MPASGSVERFGDFFVLWCSNLDSAFSRVLDLVDMGVLGHLSHSICQMNAADALVSVCSL